MPEQHFAPIPQTAYLVACSLCFSAVWVVYVPEHLRTAHHWTNQRYIDEAWQQAMEVTSG